MHLLTGYGTKRRKPRGDVYVSFREKVHGRRAPIASEAYDPELT